MKLRLIRTKKGATLKDTFIAATIGIFIVFALMTFATEHATESGIVFDSNTTAKINSLQNQQDAIKDNANAIKSSVNNITEAPPGVFGIQGLSGALALMKLPITVISTGVQSTFLALGLVDFLDSTVVTVISSVIMIMIVFGIVAFILNRVREP